MLMNDDNVVCKYASDNGNDVVRILVNGYYDNGGGGIMIMVIIIIMMMALTMLNMIMMTLMIYTMIN